jgi:diguanylate cyclase (GGDEF)-like protein/PAS domain S-box-containing protein
MTCLAAGVTDLLPAHSMTAEAPDDPPDDARRRGRAMPVILAVAVGLIALGLQLGLAWNQAAQESAATAQRMAHSIRPLETAPLAWRSQVQAMLDVLRPDDGTATSVQVTDLSGQTLASLGRPAGALSIARSAEVSGPQGAVGTLRVSRPLSGLAGSALLGLLTSLGLALAVFFGLRRVQATRVGRSARPRAKGLSAARSGDDSAHVLRVLFDRSDDGLLICAGGGRILACNPAAERLLGTPAAAVVGSNVADWLAANAERSGDKPFPVGTGEVAARRRGSPESFAAAVEVHETHQDGESRCIVSVRDLTEHQRTQEKLQYLANYDSLTGLPNRALFRDRLQQAMQRAQRSGQPMALMFLDLDRFKVVNDSLGHEVGDRLLCHVAETLTRCLRQGDSVGREGHGEPFTLSRLGGDEFTVIVEGIGGVEDAALIARRLLDALVVPFPVGDEELHVSASIGISMYPVDDVDLDGMIRHTDMAMYRSKSLGRNTFSFFSDDLNAAVGARLSLEGNLRRALERKEFVLFYQPKADLVTGRVTGVEALIRWHAPGRGMVPPDRFIAVLEDTGLIVPVGAWVIRAACKQLTEWDKMGLPPINMAVNLSARQLRHPYLVALVEDTLRETGIEAARLELELTESLLMEDTEVNKGVLAAFSRLGVRLAIDDFGTGHSSLSYLRRLEVDTLKIDRSFVTAIPNDPEDCAIATAVLALGQSLQMKVVAEGVETEEQAEFLRNLGCGEMQGWLLSRALPAHQMAEWLRGKHDEFLARSTPKRFGATDEELRAFHLVKAVAETH